MDAFRILSRSRKRAQRSGSGDGSKSIIPSSGVPSTPQLYGTASSVAELTKETEPSKRQKCSPQSNDAVQVPTELDFFADGSAKPARTLNGGDQEPRDQAPLAPEQQQTKEDGINDGPDSTMVDEDFKKVLRSHKIKIVQLWPSEHDTPEAGEGKKRKRGITSTEAEQKLKRRKLELFPRPLTAFSQVRSQYGISKALAVNIANEGYKIPTEVQLGSLPLLLNKQPASTLPRNSHKEDTKHGGMTRTDLLTVAPTGSGKTLAFLIPLAHALVVERRTQDEAQQNQGTKAIIIAPTKELAGQIVNEGRKLLLNTGIRISLVRKGMRITTASAGEAVSNEGGRVGDEETGSDSEGEADAGKTASKSIPVKAHILVSTPLSLLHAIQADGASTGLENVEYLILDEADVLLDPLFREQTLQIWKSCENPKLQVSLWSATMGASIESLASDFITERWNRLQKTHNLLTSSRPRLLRLVVGMKDSSIPSIQHKLLYAANEQGKLMALRQLLRPSVGSNLPPLRPPFLVFTQTIPRAIALHAELLYDIPQEAGGSSRIAVLHSDLSDGAREATMTRFRRGEIWILITTDLLSRGVDFKGINGVVNYDFPNSSAVYVHRVGRTGRAGREGGIAVTLYAKEDIPFVKNVANVIAASEKQKGEGDSGAGTDAQQWLFDALPTPSKREKQQLKRRGVESRRAPKPGDGAEKGQRVNTRISTKSGYERKLENRKFKGNKAAESAVAQDVEDGDEFGGFDD